MHPKGADRLADSVVPDQTAPGSALFAQTYLPQYLEFLLFSYFAWLTYVEDLTDIAFSAVSVH